jgi:hypothetical protein
MLAHTVKPDFGDTTAIHMTVDRVGVCNSGHCPKLPGPPYETLAVLFFLTLRQQILDDRVQPLQRAAASSTPRTARCASGPRRRTRPTTTSPT